MLKKCESLYREAEKFEEDLGSEILDNSRKKALCSMLELRVTKLDSSHKAIIQIVKSEFGRESLKTLS